MLSNYKPLVSIVIPTRNEAEDIAETLEHCLSIDYANKEIIVVDDSSDKTPSIVASFGDKGVHLIHRDHNANGCCGARNVGMANAHGEIVILFNADDRPEPNFIKQVLAHYENGADYVIVRSSVQNMEDIWARYTFSEGKIVKDRDPEWSEGFSCRRSAASTVGYIPGDFPLPFCRDFMLGVSLNKAGYRKVVDLSIPVDHIVPGTLKSYWRNQVWRGSFSSPFSFYLRKTPISIIWIRESLKLGRTLIFNLFIFLPAWKSYLLSKNSPRGLQDFFPFLFAGVIRDSALRVGNLSGLIKLTRFLMNN